MLEIKINQKNDLEIQSEGTFKERIENIRVLDTVRENIINDIIDDITDYMKNRRPEIPAEIHKRSIKQAVEMILNDITVISRKVKNDE